MGLEMNRVVSAFDKIVYEKIRKNVEDFLERESLFSSVTGKVILDIAPQDHAGAAKHFKDCAIYTADINPSSRANYIIDICNNNSNAIPDNTFDIVVCTEVLEHTLNPFSAVAEMYRMLKFNGTLLLSTPFDFRIHGPLPDCWRFTEHGLRALLAQFSRVDITPLENEGRFLMPFHYTTVARK